MLTYTERVRKSISREVRQHHFDSTTALQAQQVNWARYGCASGPANSEARRQQCIKPLRYNHAAFRCCKSYRNDKDAWHAWFMNLKQGTNKWQAVRRWAQAEQHSAIRNLISLHQVDICLEKANPCLQKWIGVLRTPIYHIRIYRTGTVCYFSVYAIVCIIHIQQSHNKCVCNLYIHNPPHLEGDSGHQRLVKTIRKAQKIWSLYNKSCENNKKGTKRKEEERVIDRETTIY